MNYYLQIKMWFDFVFELFIDLEDEIKLPKIKLRGRVQEKQSCMCTKSKKIKIRFTILPDCFKGLDQRQMTKAVHLSNATICLCLSGDFSKVRFAGEMMLLGMMIGCLKGMHLVRPPARRREELVYLLCTTTTTRPGCARTERHIIFCVAE